MKIHQYFNINFNDLTDKKFGKLRVIRKISTEERIALGYKTVCAHWEVQCACGRKPFIISGSELTKKNKSGRNNKPVPQRWACKVCTDRAVKLKQKEETFAKIKAEGWKVVVATNQSAVGRGIIQLTDLFDIHAKLLNCVRRFGADIDGIFFCPHRPSQKCTCRKPKPGMFQEITKRFGVVGKYCITVGDSLRDLKAAEAISARSFLVLTGNGEKTLKEHESLDNLIPRKVEIESDLSSVAEKIS